MSEFPRAIDMQRWTPAERAIADATRVVEAMPADPRLTRAVVLLSEARASVANFVDGEPDQPGRHFTGVVEELDGNPHCFVNVPRELLGKIVEIRLKP